MNWWWKRGRQKDPNESCGWARGKKGEHSVRMPKGDDGAAAPLATQAKARKWMNGEKSNKLMSPAICGIGNRAFRKERHTYGHLCLCRTGPWSLHGLPIFSADRREKWSVVLSEALNLLIPSASHCCHGLKFCIREIETVTKNVHHGGWYIAAPTPSLNHAKMTCKETWLRS